MRAVDMDAHRVVCRGIPWPSDCAPPSAKDMLARLERNEALISWLQPKGGGVEDQFPAIQVGAVFFTISLRMMKAVWRHVRLKRGFVNRETVPHIGVRLRIPTLLLCEKIRTQQRFNMMRVKQRVAAADGDVRGEGGGKEEGLSGGGSNGGTAGGSAEREGGIVASSKRRRKGHPEGGGTAGEGALGLAALSSSTTTTTSSSSSMSACCVSAPCNFRDMLWVVENWIVSAEPAAPSSSSCSTGTTMTNGGLGGAGVSAGGEEAHPRRDDPTHASAWAGITRFRLDETELFENLVYQMRRDCPRLCSELSYSSSSPSSMALLLLSQPDA